MGRVNLLFALLICVVLVSSGFCVEFEEEFYKTGNRNGAEGRKESESAAGWHSGLFDFDDDFFWRSRSSNSPKNRPGQSDKEIIDDDEEDGAREPFDVDFVSQPVGGGSPAEGSDIFGPDAGAVNPFFPFGNNFGFGGLFPFNFGGGSEYKPWWMGDNVCVEREEDIEDWERPGSGLSGAFSVNFETCEDKPNKHICTTVTNFQGKKRTVTVSRKCCHGSSRSQNGPCHKFELLSVLDTAEKLGAKKFIRSVQGLEEKLAENITLFVQVDGSFKDLCEQMIQSNLVLPLPSSRNRRAANNDCGISTKDLALAHMVKGFNQIEEIENEQLLATELENATIRVNIFPKPSVDFNRFQFTANCVPLTSYDKLASNGIVHSTQSALVPVTQTLMEMVEQREDLVVLRTILKKTDLAEQLSNQDKTFTLFAPNDAAFSKLEPSIRRVVKDGNGCALNILKNHILDLTFCGAAVVEKAKTNTFNLLGERLFFERTSAGAAAESKENNDASDSTEDLRIIINKQATIKEADLMASNGVMHIIDTLLETDSARPITSVMESKNLTIFKRLIEEGNLEETFNGLANASFFVPTDKAFDNSEWKTLLENEPESLKDNSDLRKFLEYHIADYMKTCNLTEEMITTQGGGALRVNLYSTHSIFSNVLNRATVNCARLVHYDVDSCGSVLHQVDKVLTPPSKSLLEVLESTKKYSKFLKLIREANLTDLIADPEKDYTLLVPSDDVFAEQEDWYQQLLSDSDNLERIMKSHILPDVLCCTGIIHSEWPFIRTIKTVNDKSLRIDRNRRPMIGNAGITKCDVIATNGVVHEINDVIIIKESTRPPFIF